MLASGNHDKWQILQELKSNGLIEDCFFKIAEMKLDGVPITMTHFPLLEWNQCFWNGLQLFGHIHNNYGVGVDVNNFQPVSWDYVRSIIS